MYFRLFLPNDLFRGQIEGCAKIFWLDIIKYTLYNVIMQKFDDFKVTDEWLDTFYRRFSYEFRTLYFRSTTGLRLAVAGYSDRWWSVHSVKKGGHYTKEIVIIEL